MKGLIFFNFSLYFLGTSSQPGLITLTLNYIFDKITKVCTHISLIL